MKRKSKKLLCGTLATVDRVLPVSEVLQEPEEILSCGGVNLRWDPNLNLKKSGHPRFLHLPKSQCTVKVLNGLGSKRDSVKNGTVYNPPKEGAQEKLRRSVREDLH